MAEVEYEGIKMSGSKMLLILPLLGTLIGGLWGGFELVQSASLKQRKGISRSKAGSNTSRACQANRINRNY